MAFSSHIHDGEKTRDVSGASNQIYVDFLKILMMSTANNMQIFEDRAVAAMIFRFGLCR